MLAMIARCDCANEYQDRTYGKGLRVHNPSKSKHTGNMTDRRCTVCSKVKEVRD